MILQFCTCIIYNVTNHINYIHKSFKEKFFFVWGERGDHATSHKHVTLIQGLYYVLKVQ